MLLNDVGLTGLQRQKLQLARPHRSIASVAATSSIGPAALKTLRDAAARALGTTPAPTPAPGPCQDENCYANREGTWVQARGEFARSTMRGSGGSVIWLTNSGFGPPAP